MPGMNAAEETTLDLLVIGAGPIGLACGIEAEKKELNYRIIEKGCLVNSLYNYPRNMTFFSTSDRLEIGGVPFISHLYKPTRSEALEYYRRVASTWNLKVQLYEEVLDVEVLTDAFVIRTTKGQYRTKALALATGFYDRPYMLNVPGEDLPKVKHYYDEPHPYWGQKVVVVGAANSAVDVALETYRKGAEVTMVIRDEQVRESVKYWVRPDIENRIKEGTIPAYFNSTITRITEHTVEINTPEGPKTLENDFVLAMTGYQPNFDLLDQLGVQIGEDEYRTPVYDDQTQESNVANCFLAGVICGGLKTNKWFIENSREHAITIVNTVAQRLNQG